MAPFSLSKNAINDSGVRINLPICTDNRVNSTT